MRHFDLPLQYQLLPAEKIGSILKPLASKPASLALDQSGQKVVEFSSLQLKIGGWHDVRHTLSTTLRQDGVHPKVVSDLLGHTETANEALSRAQLAI